MEGVDVNELVKRKVPRLSMTCYPQGIKNQSKAEVIKDIKGLNRSAHVKSMNKRRSETVMKKVTRAATAKEKTIKKKVTRAATAKEKTIMKKVTRAATAKEKTIKAPVELERWEKSAESLPAGVFSTAGKKQAAAGLEIRQCTGEVPSGTRPDRYGGRFFKEPAVPAAEESPRLAPTAAVADFKRRRQETAAERLARKASKSHKQNLDEYNELMEKIPVHRQKAEEAKEEAQH